jgi:hypothetical protein
MDQPFCAAQFVQRLAEGAFDGRLHVAFRKLSRDQLEQVAVLLANRGNPKESDSIWSPSLEASDAARA